MAGEAEEATLNIHPMEQFEVKPLFGDGPIHWYTPTNVTLWLFIAIVAIVLLMVMATRGRAVVPSRGQSVAEVIYTFVRTMIVDITGEAGLKYFPYIMTLFLLILFANVLGLLPYSFTVTSHVAVTGVLAHSGVHRGYVDRLCRQRHQIPEDFLDLGSPAGLAAHSGGDRNNLLLCAPCQPLHSSGGEHDGGPLGDRGVRGLCGGACRQNAAGRGPVGPRCGDHGGLRA